MYVELFLSKKRLQELGVLGKFNDKLLEYIKIKIKNISHV